MSEQNAQVNILTALFHTEKMVEAQRDGRFQSKSLRSFSWNMLWAVSLWPAIKLCKDLERQIIWFGAIKQD